MELGWKGPLQWQEGSFVGLCPTATSPWMLRQAGVGWCCRTEVLMAGTGHTGRRCGHMGVLVVLQGAQRFGDFRDHPLSHEGDTPLRTLAQPSGAIPGRFWGDPLDPSSLPAPR